MARNHSRGASSVDETFIVEPTRSAKSEKPFRSKTQKTTMDFDTDAQHTDTQYYPVVGWLVVLKGPGRGQFRPFFYGQSSIGRGEEQRIQVNFGDEHISRSTHATIIYDEKTRRYFIAQNGKANLVRLNGSVLIESQPLKARDKISIGQTIFQFVPFCGPDFDWSDKSL